MSGVLPLNKPSKDVVLDAINDRNNSTLTFSDVDLSLPVDVTDQQIGVNTVVTVLSKDGSQYYGNVVMEYNRIDLAALVSDSVILVNGPVMEHTLAVDLLNDIGGLHLEYDELESVHLDEDGILDLAGRDSYLYLPNSIVRVRDEFDHWLDNMLLAEADMITGLRAP